MFSLARSAFPEQKSAFCSAFFGAQAQDRRRSLFSLARSAFPEQKSAFCSAFRRASAQDSEKSTLLLLIAAVCLCDCHFLSSIVEKPCFVNLPPYVNMGIGTEVCSYRVEKPLRRRWCHGIIPGCIRNALFPFSSRFGNDSFRRRTSQKMSNAL